MPDAGASRRMMAGEMQAVSQTMYDCCWHSWLELKILLERPLRMRPPPLHAPP